MIPVYYESNGYVMQRFIPGILNLVLLVLLPAVSPGQNLPGGKKAVRTDLFGDPLPAGVLARMGSGRLRHGEWCSIAFAPDGRSLISYGSSLHIWDVATGKSRRHFDFGTFFIHTLAFSRDRLILVSSQPEDGVMAQTLNPLTGEIQPRFVRRESNWGGRASFSPSGDRLAVAVGNRVRVLDSSTGAEICQCAVPGRCVYDVKFSLDGQRLVVCEYTHHVYLFSALDGKKVLELKHARNEIVQASLSPDGRSLAVIGAGRGRNLQDPPAEVSIWDLDTEKERHRLKTPGDLVFCLAFSPDSRLLATGCRHPDLVVWDVATGREVRRFTTSNFNTNVAFSPDGKVVAAVSSANDGAIRLWDVATGRVLPGSADPLGSRVVDLHFQADGKRLLGAGAMRLAWDPVTGRELHRYPHLPDTSWYHPLSPDGTLLATADPDGTLRIWEAATGKPVRAWKGHEGWVSYLLFSADGRQLYSWCEDGSLGAWDVTTGHELHWFRTPRRTAQRLEVSPDGALLAAARAGSGIGPLQVVLWDLRTGNEKIRLDMELEGVAMQLAFSPDSRLVAAVGGNLRVGHSATLRVWETNGGRSRYFNVLPTADLVSVAFAPDGRTLAAGARDGRIFLWELATGQKRGELLGHEKAILSLAFSPDGRLLAAASPEAPAYVWDLAALP
jgi:WD40 repeat protein